MARPSSLRIADVCTRIEADLSAPWRITALARIAGMAQHNFQRQFAAATGETVAGYIRARRLEHAALRLQDTDHRVIDIALDTGFQTHAALTRAFRTHFGTSPRRFRETGAVHRRSDLPTRPYLLPITSNSTHLAWDEVLVPDRWLCARTSKGLHDGRFFGDPTDIGREFEDLWTKLAGRPAVLATAFRDAPTGFQDPDATAHYGALLPERAELTWSSDWTRIEAGSYAVFPHHGPYTALHLTWNRCARAGFGQLGVKFRLGWMIETYLAATTDQASDELTALIYLPIAKSTNGQARKE
ncbi:MAG: helix-turn-helix domain-containing protein [Pseudomonadota bacterium]